MPSRLQFLHPRRRPARPSFTGAAYAAVLLAAIGSAWWQPGQAEAPAHADALLTLATWAGGGLIDAASGTPSH